jgi:hypothetical protein
MRPGESDGTGPARRHAVRDIAVAGAGRWRGRTWRFHTCAGRVAEQRATAGPHLGCRVAAIGRRMVCR